MNNILFPNYCYLFNSSYLAMFVFGLNLITFDKIAKLNMVVQRLVNQQTRL